MSLSSSIFLEGATYTIQNAVDPILYMAIKPNFYKNGSLSNAVVVGDTEITVDSSWFINTTVNGAPTDGHSVSIQNVVNCGWLFPPDLGVLAVHGVSGEAFHWNLVPVNDGNYLLNYPNSDWYINAPESGTQLQWAVPGSTNSSDPAQTWNFQIVNETAVACS